MKRAVAFILVSVLLVSIIGLALSSSLNAQNEPIWPMEGFNPQRTGQCPYDVSQNNLIWKWRYQTSSNASPAIGPDDTIYVSYHGPLYAINPDGTLKWQFNFDLISLRGSSSPAIGSDGTVYIGRQIGFYAVNPDGTQKWKYDGDFRYTSPAVTQDGTIYAIGTKDNVSSLFAFNPDGTLKWKYDGNFGSGSRFAVSQDGTIYVRGQSYVYVLNPDGTLKYRWNINALNIVIGPDGTIYLGWNGLTAMNPDGTIKWAINNSSGPLACNSDGTIYTTVGGLLTAVNPDGTIKWKSNIGVYQIVIAKDGYLIAEYRSGLAILDNQGNIVRKTNILGLSFNKFVVGSNGTIYALGSDGLYALGNPDVTLPTAPQNLTIEKVDGVIKLSWSPSTAGTYPSAGYAIFRSTDGKSFSYLDKTIDAATTTYTDYSATNQSSTYYYYVVALDNRTPSDCSLPSNEVSIGPPDFAISVEPTTATVNQGDSATFTVTLTAKYGFNSEVSLSASGHWTTAVFEPQTLTPTESGATSTLTLTVSDSATPGTYNINVNASGGGKNHNATISLTITSGGPKKGDVNGDGYITAQDAILVLRYKAGYITLTDDQKARADMNGDGVIDETDAQLILKKAVGQ